MSSDIDSPVIEAAKADALHERGACEDMGAVLFPQGRHLPSEALQAAVRAKLHDLIISLVHALWDNEAAEMGPVIWLRLAENGDLRRQPLLAFAMARVSEDHLNNRIKGENSDAILSFLPSRLLGSDSEPVAMLARNLLVVEQACRYPQKWLYTQLEPVVLNELLWQVANIMIEIDAGKEAAIKREAQALLANHQMASQIGIAAQKLLFAIWPDYEDDLHDPVRAGLPMFMAELEREFSLPRNNLLRMIDADTAAPLSMLLALRGLSRDVAANQIELLRGRSRDDQEIASIFLHYNDISASMSQSALAQWRKLDGDVNAT